MSRGCIKSHPHFVHTEGLKYDGKSERQTLLGLYVCLFIVDPAPSLGY